MKILRLTDSEQEPLLRETDVPQPEVREGEVLVEVHATGITPSELAWHPTWHEKNGEKRQGAVLSHEFSGTIAAIGNGVKGLYIGQAIYGMNDWFAEGALAQYCVTQADWIAPKPLSLDFAQAASVPIGALTAWQGLYERAKLTAGERVLIHGGAGSVGIFALQLARLRGAYAITTVSADDFEFVRELGADEVLDYKTSRFEESIRDIDVVFDGVGGDTLARSWGVLKPNGRLVTVAADSEGRSDERSKNSFFIVEPKRDQLIQVGRLIDAGDLRTVVDRVLPFSAASDAYAGKVERSGRGKLVVAVVEGRSEAARR